MQAAELTSQFALDIASVGKLKSGAGLNARDPSLRSAARQFEAIFLQQMLTSMRDATTKSELLNSSQSDFFASLMDQQWAQHMAGAGMGLADQLVQQLTDPAHTERLPGGALAAPSPGDIRASLNERSSRFFERVDSLSATQRAPLPVAENIHRSKTEFVEDILAEARVVESKTGVPAELMTAQAVLETAWGSREIHREDGSSTFNVFGMKTNAGWQGDTVDVLTHEYIGERRVQVTETFKAYDSYEEAFSDYARLISQNPRYAGVVGAETSAEAIDALLNGGYATDPAYGQKLQALLDQGLAPQGGP